MDRRITLEQLYEFVSEDDDEGSTCEAIPDEACRQVPYNFFLNALNGAVTLGAGLLGLIAEVLSVEGLLIVFLLLMGLGINTAWRMPEAEHMAR